jgi:hypothetical protein
VGSNQKAQATARANDRWNSAEMQGRFGGLLAMKELPADREKLTELGIHITNDIASFVSGRLSAEDRALWLQPDEEGVWTDASTRRIWGVFDHVVIERAESTYTGFIYLSSVVQMRMSQWNLDPEQGFKRIEELHRAVERGNRLRLGEGKLPITEREWKANKRQAVGELRRLFKQFRSVFDQQRTAPTYEEAREWLQKTVRESTVRFGFLSRNMDSLFSYIEQAAAEDGSIKKYLRMGQLKPGQLFDNWGAHGRNLSPQNFRQSISSLKKV